MFSNIKKLPHVKLKKLRFFSCCFFFAYNLSLTSNNWTKFISLQSWLNYFSTVVWLHGIIEKESRVMRHQTSKMHTSKRLSAILYTALEIWLAIMTCLNLCFQKHNVLLNYSLYWFFKTHNEHLEFIYRFFDKMYLRIAIGKSSC